MSRNIEASCRQCRREGTKLYLKGERCYSTNKCAFERRPTPPGQHGKRRTKLSEYGLQLREKQKAKRIYGVLEKQFREYFEIAAKQKGITGHNLLIHLESRLDNVVYRLGMATSRKEARQLVDHEHFLVNGKKVNIPSYIVKEGDIIEVRQKSKKSQKFKDIVETTENRMVAPWLSSDLENLSGKVTGRPAVEDLDVEIAEHLIVELYSK
ncbi:MAG: small subunit ribosomal protein [Eubacteriaceae bacterium]|jgi:small subunit ribosomal protein S4|nr:small subunit ribosomal protein [Eubacteriaceae bacterium]